MGIVHIEIDGVALEAETGSMIIEVADEAGLTVPRFCYHKKLSVAANCRMCLVDVSNLPKAVPACATPVAEGMKILTDSPKAKMAQKSVMEFLLINHPLDCPICDQGGECELQDVALEYGSDVSRFTEGKRVVQDKNIGPLIATDMTRCIHCTRCVRFGTEVAGIREMGATGRGEHMEIGTFIEKSIESEVSGNIIDLCPVGALTAKPSRFRARAWEIQSTPAIAPHDCLGTNISIHHRRGEVIRVVPEENEDINEVWISDRDRFSYESLNKAKRLLTPKIKKDNEWQDATWEEALSLVADQFKSICESRGAESIGCLVSSSSTTEEMYLAQRLMRGLGSHNIDHRLRQVDFSCQHDDPLYPGLEFSISDFEEMDATLLIGSDLRKEQPLLALRLRKSTRFGQVMAVNSFEANYNFKLSVDLQANPADIPTQLHGVVAALIKQQKDPVSADLVELFADVEFSPEQEKIASQLRIAENACVVLGQSGLEHSNSGHLRWLARTIARLSHARYGELSHGANSAGGHIAGALPHRTIGGTESDVCGWNTIQMLQKGLEAYLLVNTEPDLDSSYKDAAQVALLKANFVVCMTPFAQGQFLDYANVLLPTAAFSETSGSYVSVEGKWQSFTAAVKAKGEARPAWKILRVLGNLLDVSGFDYNSSKDVRNEVKTRSEAKSELVVGQYRVPEQLEKGGESPRRLGLYDADPLVRRSPSLQATADAKNNWRYELIQSIFGDVS
ncbi:NADH-quinone oxidoreductase subunit NuoG [Pleionea sp. CnH1-48]|uniref:NADH-quinone oxidoreductase subunit NuoG n=1 Tax=Pleionea sp. CnH1-48 TaxID=2954494 RepID=UPI0020972A00|nr:NADH-quinone oxidoreductase subunit NuoG [Pleionea sp. CnH1-48]